MSFEVETVSYISQPYCHDWYQCCWSDGLDFVAVGPTNREEHGWKAGAMRSGCRWVYWSALVSVAVKDGPRN